MKIKGKILSKAPCKEDLFEGQAHLNLANVIADQILTDSQCTIIGIDGGWGSGKSNLVGLVEKILKDDSKRQIQGKYHFFTYDAWGHQNDLPRRSILEELTEFIASDENQILNGKRWKEKLGNLLAKKKHTSTKTIPRINFAIIVLSLLVALTPVVSSINEVLPNAWIKIIFSVLFYGSALFFVYKKQRQNMKEYDQEFTWVNFFKELFLLYAEKVKEDEKYETISEREPSTRQFKEWMRNIDKDLLAVDKYLVIVIDNMDRLPKLKVQELWSAIHSFFSETQYDNIRVIVPFDRLHIRNAFQSEDIVMAEANDLESGKVEKEVAVYGDDFINKTFYIVYHVAPPILSGWKDYFETMWYEAFGENCEIDNAVLQVYDLMTKEHTPRKIVAFIDEFVTVKSIADESIPDKYIALFIFGRTTIAKDPFNEILVPSYLRSLDFLYKDDANMPKFMSALYYQLPVDKAMDVVYTRQFTRELDENNLDSIKKIKESSSNKFKAILERSLAMVTNTNNATLALENLFLNETSSEIDNFWACLYNKDKSSRLEITKFLPYHKILLDHIKDKNNYWNALISGYHSAFDDTSDVKKYLGGIDELAQVMSFDVYGRLSRVKKEISPAQFIALVEDKENTYKQYGLTCSDTKLSEYLVGLTVEDWKNLSILPFLDRKNEYPLSSFVQAIEEKIRNANLQPSDAEILFDRLKEMKEGQTISYNSYFQNNKLESLFNSTKDDFRNDLMAMRISALDNYSSSSSYLQNALNDDSEETIVAIAKVVQSYINYGEMLTGLESFSMPIFKSLCKYLTLHSVGVQRMSIKNVAKKFDVIVNNSDISEDELFIKLNGWRKFKENITVDDVPSLPLNIFESAKRNDCELATYLLDLSDKYLSSLDQNEWEEYLQSKDSLQLQLLRIHHPNKNQTFFDAFKLLMKEYANSSEGALPIETVNSVLEISKDLKHDVKRLFMDIRDIYLSVPITEIQLKYFGHWLFDYANLEKKEGCLERILPSEYLDDTTIISYMNNHKDVVKGMVEHSSDPSEFKEKLLSMLIGSRKDDENLKSLCEYLNIEEPKKKDQD